MIRLVWLVALAVACGRSKGVSDDQLGGLVVEPKPPAKIDVPAATSDAAELSRALASTHGAVLAALGPHTFSVDTKTIVEESSAQVSELTDHAALELGDGGSFKGLYTNSADYGREVIFIAPPAGAGKKELGTLYLRPRYQRWHKRGPETPVEAAQIREQYFGAIAATWDLVAPGAELTDRGAVTVAGRSGRKVELKLAPSPRENPPEVLAQRLWRQGRSVLAVTGEITLDAESGVPLAVKLAGSVAFSREGRRFTMKLELDAKLVAIGAVAIAPPPDAEVVATPERRREVDDRDFLLHGLAPPIRKNSDGTSLTPAPAAKPAPADKPKPKSGKKSDDKKPEPAKPDGAKP